MQPSFRPQSASSRPQTSLGTSAMSPLNFRPQSASSQRPQTPQTMHSTMARASGAARPSSPLLSSLRSISTVGQSRNATPALYVALRDKALSIAEGFEEPRIAPPLDRTPTKTTRIEVSRKNKDEIFARIRQLRVEQAHAEGTVKELLDSAVFLQKELEKNDSQIVNLQRSLQDVTFQNQESMERAQHNASLAQAYEQFHFVPTEDDVTELWKEVGALERDVTQQAKLAGETLPRPPVPMPFGLSKTAKMQALVEAKFHALDNLVFVLRKRIARLEEHSAVVATMHSKGIRNVEDVMKENDQLIQENQRLRLREQRFATDSLLRRRVLTKMSPSSLRSLVIALQNELTIARTVIDGHNLELNPAQRWLILPPHADPPESEMRDIDELLERNDQEAMLYEADDEVVNSPIPPENLIRTLQEREFGLREQIEELRKELDLAKRVVGDEPEEVFELPTVRASSDSKRARTKQVQRINDDLLAQIASLQEQISETRESQENVRELLLDEQNARGRAEGQALKMSQNVRGMKYRIRMLEDYIKQLQQINEAERVTAITLAMAQLEQSVPRAVRHKVLSLSFSDMVSLHCRMSRAAVTLQSWARGVNTRRIMSRKYGGSRFRRTLHIIRTWRGQVRALEVDVSPRRPPLEAHVLPAYGHLQRTLLAVIPNAVAASQPNEALKLMRHSVLGTVRAEAVNALRIMKEEMNRTVSLVHAAVRAAHPPTHDDYVQATPDTTTQQSSAVPETAEVGLLYEDPTSKKPVKR